MEIEFRKNRIYVHAVTNFFVYQIHCKHCAVPKPSTTHIYLSYLICSELNCDTNFKCTLPLHHAAFVQDGHGLCAGPEQSTSSFYSKYFLPEDK